MNLKNYKKLVALSLTGALTLAHPESVKATQYNQNIVNIHTNAICTIYKYSIKFFLSLNLCFYYSIN